MTTITTTSTHQWACPRCKSVSLLPLGVNSRSGEQLYSCNECAHIFPLSKAALVNVIKTTEVRDDNG